MNDNKDIEFSTSKDGEIQFKEEDECEVIIPNPSGKAPAIITMRREQVVQYINDKPDVVEFNFILKLTEEQMENIKRQWAANNEEEI